MTASKAKADVPAEPLTESDHAETSMAYVEGSGPGYILVTWVGFRALLVAYVVIYYVPDLREWLELPAP